MLSADTILHRPTLSHIDFDNQQDLALYLHQQSQTCSTKFDTQKGRGHGNVTPDACVMLRFVFVFFVDYYEIIRTVLSSDLSASH